MTTVNDIEDRRAAGEEPAQLCAPGDEMEQPRTPRYCKRCGRVLKRTNLRRVGFNERTGGEISVYDYQCPKYGFFGMMHDGPTTELPQ